MITTLTNLRILLRKMRIAILSGMSDSFKQVHWLWKQPPGVFYKKAVLTNFAIFTGNTCVEVYF